MNFSLNCINTSISNSSTYSFGKGKSVSFSGQRLLKVPLVRINENGVAEKLSGFFTKMDETDKELVNSLPPAWEKSTYGGCVIRAFQRLFDETFPKNNATDNLSCYMVECPQLADSSERVRSLALVQEFPQAKKLKVVFLQSASSLPTKEDIKYGGSTMLSSLSKIAENKGYGDIYLHSGNPKTDKWYEEIGFTERENYEAVYDLPSNFFGWFRDTIDYKIKKKLGALANISKD